jgi:putative dimethyl sulfoxide reductase chaperone
MDADEVISNEEMAQFAAMRSKVYAFLSNFFNNAPDQKLVGWLTNGTMEDTLVAIAASDDQPDILAGLKHMRAFAAAVKDMPPAAIETDLAVDRTRLCRGVMPGYGPPPPYESVYTGVVGADMGQMARSVQQCYAEAGVSVPEDLHEPADYIGLELDFLSYLADKESQAWQSGNEADAGLRLQQATSFLCDHLAAWAPQYCAAMVKEARTDFYRGIALLLKGFLASDRARVAGLVV